MARQPRTTNSGEFHLEVPLDASGIKDFKPDHRVRVVVYDRAGAIAGSTTANLDENGRGHATLAFESRPGGVRVVVGPESASEDDLKHLQTLTVDVPPGQWQEQSTLRITPVVISQYYWDWWLWWCRDYTITGRLVCADGSPVPGATVCAYDVDWWWWWLSESQVGCAVTKADGTFQISFRRCCGWYWWWWWELRNWRVESVLADRIVPLLQKVPGIRRVPLPDPAPDLKVFQSLLGETGAPALSRALAAPRTKAGGSASFNPAALETLRAQLLAKLPASPELERLRVWPWWPWWPWWDCDADIIFRATQNCNGRNSVILDETVLQTRFDIPTQLNVTLIANDEACCLAQGCQDSDCPPDNCVTPIDICYFTSAEVGGNPGASSAAATIGYANPGGATPGSPFGDRPFCEGVLLSANTGDVFVDYYEFEWSTSPGGPWSAMPLPADGGFYRVFWDASLNSHSVLFNATSISSRNVFESRQHYAANNSIGIGWDGLSNYNTLMWWQTSNTGFTNGTYYLRLIGYTRAGYTGDLSNPQPVPFCDKDGKKGADSYVVVTIDNRPTPGPGAGHPTDHPCGGGTVHLCTTEPDCNIFQVTIGGQTVGPCANITAKDTDPVTIEFMAHDDDRILAYYALACTFGLDSVIPVLCTDVNGVPDASLGVLVGSLAAGPPASNVTSWISPAAQTGPDYGTALAQGATAPYWAGGTLTLTTTVGELFPISCAYQLQLWVYKRNVVNCDDSPYYYNLTELSFTVTKA
jgi:hypothetical protein